MAYWKMNPTIVHGTKFTAVAGGMSPVPANMTGRLDEELITKKIKLDERILHAYLTYLNMEFGHRFVNAQGTIGAIAPRRKKYIKA